MEALFAVRRNCSSYYLSLTADPAGAPFRSSLNREETVGTGREVFLAVARYVRACATAPDNHGNTGDREGSALHVNLGDGLRIIPVRVEEHVTRTYVEDVGR